MEAHVLTRLLNTNDSWSLTINRCVLAFVMLPHGAQKLLGLFGGYGFSPTMAFFTDTMHLPAVIAFLVIIAESFGSLGLLLGAGSRVAAFGISMVMIGAVLTAHLPNGFFMNWFGNQKGEGFEYHLLALGLAIPVLLQGGGLFALDKLLLARIQSTATASGAATTAA
jgi:putative oxidoreductase